LIGWVLELIYGVTSQGLEGGFGHGLVGGLRVFCLLWFASGAAFFIGTIGGLLFGVPKTRVAPSGAETLSADRLLSEASGDEGSRHLYDNTNLDEVSDWLTKIIIGIGLAQFSQVINFLDQIGDRVGKSVDPSGQYGGYVVALGSIIIGFATGFLRYTPLRSEPENPWPR
jgi:hypothetical protein